MRGFWRLIGPLLAHARPLVFATVAVAGLQSALLIPIALLLQQVFDKDLHHGKQLSVVTAGAAILVLYLASAGLSLLSRGVVVRSTKVAIAELRMRLISHMYGLSPRWHDRHGRGWVHGILVQDTERIDQGVNQLLTQAGPAMFVVVALCVVALVLNPLLFGALVVTIPPMLAAGRRLGRRFASRVRRWQASFDTYSADTQVALEGLPLTKVEGAEAWELRRRGVQVHDLAETGTSLVWAQSAYVVVQGGLAAAASVVVLMVGGVAVAGGSMKLGQLVAFYAVMALILRQVGVIFSGVPIILAGISAGERVQEVLDAKESEPYHGERRITLRGAWALKAVTFGYGDDDVLRDVNLYLRAGEHVALVGPNGAGKSTVVNLLLGLYRPSVGVVAAEGVPLDELDVRDLRRQIGVVLQDPVLFRGTIRENIAYGRADITDLEISLAAARATAAGFIGELPDGYETQVGDDAVRLSGGQRQRIALARALVGDPALLILDEPTNHLDDESIRALMSTLGSLPRAPTVLIVTHDPSVAGEADRIISLRDGRVAHETLGRPREDKILVPKYS